MSDEFTPTPESPEPRGKSGATFLGLLDKYAPAEELYEAIRNAVLESRRTAAVEGQPTETE